MCDGAQLAYTLHASGQPGAPRLALVHSLALDRTVWEGVVSALGGGVDVLTYDCRGHGASEKPRRTVHDEPVRGRPARAARGRRLGPCLRRGRVDGRQRGLAVRRLLSGTARRFGLDRHDRVVRCRRAEELARARRQGDRGRSREHDRVPADALVQRRVSRRPPRRPASVSRKSSSPTTSQHMRRRARCWVHST